jgi:hypothetical protein
MRLLRPKRVLQEKVALRRKKSRILSRLELVLVGDGGMKGSLPYVLTGRRQPALRCVTYSSNRKIQLCTGWPAFDPQPAGIQYDENKRVQSPRGVGTIPTCELVFALKEGALSSPE